MTWRWTVIGIAAIVATGALTIGPFYCFGVPPSANEFGDSFGFLNAIASTLALVVVVIALGQQVKELGDARKFELLSARMNALVALLPVLPRYRATVEEIEDEKEVVDTSGGLTRERAEAELEFFVDWTRTRTFNFVTADIAPSWREAVQKLDASISDLLYVRDADANERKRYICAAAIRAEAIQQSSGYPTKLRELADHLSSVLFSASSDFTANAKIHDEYREQIKSLIEQIRLFKPQAR